MGKSKVERCLWVECMHVRIDGEPLEEVDCINYLWSQVAADAGCNKDVGSGEGG